MKNKFLLILILFYFGLALSLPVIVYAETGYETETGLFEGRGGDDDIGGSVSGSGGLPNPLGPVDPRDIMGNVIKAILGVTGSLALGVFILGGLMWVTSAGNEEKITKGKNMIMWAAFGLVVIFASYALVTFVLNALTGSG